MSHQAKHSRRKMLKIGFTALAVIPLAGFSRLASAEQNTTVRKALKFQDQPNGEKQCGSSTRRSRRCRGWKCDGREAIVF